MRPERFRPDRAPSAHAASALLAIEALLAYDVLTDDPNLPLLGQGTHLR